jgi:poly(A) polymerase
MAEEICRRLRFSSEDTTQILALVANHMRFKDVTKMRAATLKRFVRLPHFDEHLALHRLDCVSSHRRLDAYDFVRKVLAETPPEQITPPRLLTGEDLMDMGYSPSPLFSQILHALEDAQLESQVSTPEEARRFVHSKFPARKRAR